MKDKDQASDTAFSEGGFSSVQFYLELYKFFEFAGGQDKNRAITITTWLLGAVGALLLYMFGENGNATQVKLAAGLGVAICAFAAFLIMLFGAYATHNWDRAKTCLDQLEATCGLELPEADGWKRLFVRPHKGNLAIVFKYFLLLVIVLVAIFILILIKQ